MVEREIEEFNKELNNNYFAFVPGHTYRKWLVYFGATEEDLSLLEAGDIHAVVDLDTEKKMYFRQFAFQRYLLIEDAKNGERTGNQSDERTKRIFKDSGSVFFQRLYENEIVSSIEDGATIGYVRSGIRTCPLAPTVYRKSSVPYALGRLIEMFIPEKFIGLALTNSNSNYTINDQALIRINKTTEAVECPAPEGIHQDGYQISSVSLVGLKNVDKGGETRIWPLSTPTGNYSDEMFESKSSPLSKENCLLKYAMRNKWDTIIFNDRMVKHEATPFDGPRPAYRDIIINAIRKPYTDGVDKMIDENGTLISIV